jgi:hypothetical protein
MIDEPDPKTVFTAGDAYDLVCAHVRFLPGDGMATLPETAGRSDGPAGGASGKGMCGEQQLGGSESAADQPRGRPAARRSDHEACGSCGIGVGVGFGVGTGVVRLFSNCGGAAMDERNVVSDQMPGADDFDDFPDEGEDPTDQRPTFQDLAWLDMSLWDLEADAMLAARASRRGGWSPTFAYSHEFSGRIWRVVGWHRKWQTGSAADERVLRTSRAYDTVVARIFNALCGETILPEPRRC